MTCAWCRAIHGQEQSQEQVDQNGVLQNFSLSLTLARPNLLLVAPSVPVHTLTEPTTEAKLLQPCMPTSRSQHNKALCSSFLRTQCVYRQTAIKELECPLEEDKAK